MSEQDKPYIREAVVGELLRVLPDYPIDDVLINKLKTLKIQQAIALAKEQLLEACRLGGNSEIHMAQSKLTAAETVALQFEVSKVGEKPSSDFQKAEEIVGSILGDKADDFTELLEVFQDIQDKDSGWRHL